MRFAYMHLLKINIIIFLSALTFNYEASGQKPKVMNDPTHDDRRLHFGFSLGLNGMDFSFRRSIDFANNDTLFGDVAIMEPGFQVNVISDLRLGKYFNLRCMPGINFGQRSLSFYKGNQLASKMRIESNFIDLPFLFKYRAKRVNNFAPYFIAGLSAKYDLAARKDYNEESEVYVRLKPLDFYLEAGFGVDNYMQYFKFAYEIKLCLGFNDVLVHEPAPFNEQYARSFDKLTSKIVMVSFHFE